MLSGCVTLGWYAQAARGQLELLNKREHIESRIAAPDTPPEERRKLAWVLEARAFAHDDLGLPDNGSYRRYVALDREAVLWNVIAAPEFSLEPKTWCFPLVGCLAYRGWFRHARARREAGRLRKKGLDVRVSPVAAYSTLGRFEDPVTSPMLAWTDAALAGLIFHELAHQRVFAPGDTAFNEAYASVVERAGVEAFLLRRERDDLLRRWRADRALSAGFTDLLLDARARLQQVYASDLDAAAMRAERQREFQRLRQRYAEFRATASEPERLGGYDRFMQRDLNNADLVLVATYEAGTRAFVDLLAKYDGDFGRFHAAVEQLARAAPDVRAEFLNRSRNTSRP